MPRCAARARHSSITPKSLLASEPGCRLGDRRAVRPDGGTDQGGPWAGLVDSAVMMGLGGIIHAAPCGNGDRTTMANQRGHGDIQGTPSAYRLALTGSFDLACRGKPLPVPHSAERVLAYLALAGAPVSRSKLAGILWLDAPGQRAANNLRTALWRLHRVSACLVTAVDNRLRLTSDLVIDVVELSELARRLIREPESDALNQLPLLVEQIELLPDWDDEWVVADQERLRVLRLEALERAATALLRQHRLVDALIAAQAVVETEPLRESARRLVIEVHLVRGNVAEAICQYRQYRDLLRAEFAVTPSPAMERLLEPWRQHLTAK